MRLYEILWRLSTIALKKIVYKKNKNPFPICLEKLVYPDKNSLITDERRILILEVKHTYASIES